MALPYPDGECFFLKSVLRTNGNSENKLNFNVKDNPASFYKCALVEMTYNCYFQEKAWKSSSSGYTFPPNVRSGAWRVYGKDDWRVGQFEWLNVCYGDANNPSSRFAIKLNNNHSQLHDWRKGSKQICYVPVPLPTQAER
jgi:hypothetical protein